MPQASDEGRTYAIRVKGHVDPGWSDWFGGLAIRQLPGGESVICGTLADQAELHGLLTKIRDLGLPLIEVTPHRPND